MPGSRTEGQVRLIVYRHLEHHQIVDNISHLIATKWTKKKDGSRNKPIWTEYVLVKLSSGKKMVVTPNNMISHYEWPNPVEAE